MKRLDHILNSADINKVFGKTDLKIIGITDDSRKVKEGYLFVAVKGNTDDGHDFITQAIQNGAFAVIGEAKLQLSWLEKTCYIQTNDSREALGKIASAWNDHPTKKLKVIGITGTKGKSTTAYILHHLLESKYKIGSVTSIAARIGSKAHDTGLHVTNPGPIQLHGFLKTMVDEGCEYAILEVTSHGLDQKRTAGVEFDTAVITNIKHEHLDYHKTFEAYRDTKIKLFDNVNTAILNKDDESYDQITKRLSAETSTITYSTNKTADYLATYQKTNTRMEFQVKVGSEEHVFNTEMIGDYNVANFVAAIAVAKNEDVDWKDIKRSIKDLQTPSGRLERVENDKGINIYIDFAHTPDSLEKVLEFLRERHPNGRLISVFGCASERDELKRPMMAKISTNIADVSIFTAEDPRRESINKIIDEMVSGVVDQAEELTDLNLRENKKYYKRIPERSDAIAYVLHSLAKKGDTVVFCGKGHEESMAYNGVEHPWSDRRWIENTLKLDSTRSAVILAAGKGTRLNGEDAKVLRKISGKPMISYCVNNLLQSGFANINLVVGYKKNEVINRTQGFVSYSHQDKQLGGHALMIALENIPKDVDNFIVMNGDDSAFFEPDTINKIYQEHHDKKAVVSFVSLVVDDPKGLGRVFKDKKRKLLGIVEEKDATDQQRKINEVNDGFYVFNKKFVQENIEKIKKSSNSGEYYIVDLVKLALTENRTVHVHVLEDNDQWHGINTIEQLEEGDRKMREKIKSQMEN